MPLDDTDHSIIKLLRQNPRIPYSQIADTLGISRPTAQNRVKKMIKNGQIEFTASLNILNRDLIIAFLELEVKNMAHWDDCLELLNSLPWVLMGFRSMGKSNLRILIYGESEEILENNIDVFRYYHCVNFIEAEILGEVLVGNIQN